MTVPGQRARRLLRDAEAGYFAVPGELPKLFATLQHLETEQHRLQGRRFELTGDNGGITDALIEAVSSAAAEGKPLDTTLAARAQREREEAANLGVLQEAARLVAQSLEWRIETFGASMPAMAPLLQKALTDTLGIVKRAAPTLAGEPVDNPEALLGRPPKVAEAYAIVRAAFTRYQAIRSAAETVSQRPDGGHFAIFRHPELAAALPSAEQPVAHLLAVAAQDRPDGAQPWIGDDAQRADAWRELREQKGLRPAERAIGATLSA